MAKPSKDLQKLPSYAESEALGSGGSHIDLRSSDGTIHRVPTITLRSASVFFRDMISLPQGDIISGEVLTVDEPDRVLEPLLKLVNGFAIGRWDSLEVVEDVLHAAEKYKMPGPISIICSAVTSPFFLEKPFWLYAVAARYDWEDEVKLASKHTLSLSITDPANEVDLVKIPSPHLVKLYNFHLRRIAEFKRLLDNSGVWIRANGRIICRCGTFAPSEFWNDVKKILVREMERRPLGDTLLGLEMESLPEVQAFWRATCGGCNITLFSRASAVRTVKGILNQLPNTI